MSKSFILSIELGSDTIDTNAEVADALRRVASYLAGFGNLEMRFNGPSKVTDRDGNAIGTYGVQGADSLGGENRS